MFFPVKAIDLTFNAAVIAMAARFGGYRTSPNALESYEALCADYAANGVITVWDGASDRTIFGDPEVNFAFRAWHDYCHVIGGHAFTDDGERAACEMQKAHLTKFWGDSVDVRRWHAILDAEIIGQKAHQTATGSFPDDQYAFVESYLRMPGAPLSGLVAPHAIMVA